MNYIIILETENLGFIFTSAIEADEAMDFADDFFFNRLQFNINKINQIEHLRLLETYKINGNQLFFEKCSRGTSNGLMTSSLVFVDDQFCLKTLIKERENFSIPFDLVNHSEKVYRFIDQYPQLIISAN